MNFYCPAAGDDNMAENEHPIPCPPNSGGGRGMEYMPQVCWFDRNISRNICEDIGIELRKDGGATTANA